MKWQSVHFTQPEHNQLKSEGFVAVDMHNHSEYSDTTTRVSSIAKRARKLGIGVCLSDHNEIAGNIKLAEDNPDLFVVPGMEVTTKEMAHVLTYFYSHDEMQTFFEKHIRKSRSPNPYTKTKVGLHDLIDISKDYNCVLAPAHPFAFPRRFSFFHAMERGDVDNEVLKSFDAVEAICGANVRPMNKKAANWAQEIKKASIGGSDAHQLNTLGSVVTVAEASTVEDFLDAIKRKQTAVIGREMRLHQRSTTYVRIASQHLRYLGPTMKTQYELTVKGSMQTTREILRDKFHAMRNTNGAFAKLSCMTANIPRPKIIQKMRQKLR